MIALSALWLPILLAAVFVFIASSIMHMVLPYHRSDYKKLPDEEKVTAAIRAAGVTRGLYMFPFADHKQMKDPTVQEKFKQGPVGTMIDPPERSDQPGAVPGAVVPVLPGGRVLYCLHRGAHLGAGC